MPETIAADERPLLTFSVPTYNRARYLEELLTALRSAIIHEPRVELLVADNASTDGTASLLESFQAAGLPMRVLRHRTNQGSDANFQHCLEQARGRYVWIFGDDDLLVAGALAKLLSVLEQAERTAPVDLVYLSSFGFRGSYRTPAGAVVGDRLGRFAEIVTDAGYLLNKTNALLGLISVVVFHKDAFLRTPHPPLEDLRGTNLMQLGWVFPLLRPGCRVLFVWERLVAYRSHNSGGWGISEVFGIRLGRLAARFFADRPALAGALMNGVLRFWMMDSIMLARRGRERAMVLEDFAALLRPQFGRNWRFWVFVWPVASLPLPLARLIHLLLRAVNRGWRVLEGLWRHLFRRGELLWPVISPGRGHAAPALLERMPLPEEAATAPVANR